MIAEPAESVKFAAASATARHPDRSKGDGVVCLHDGRDDVTHTAHDTDGHLIGQAKPVQASRAQDQLNAFGFQGAQFWQDGRVAQAQPDAVRVEADLGWERIGLRYQRQELAGQEKLQLSIASVAQTIRIEDEYGPLRWGRRGI